MPGGGVGIVGRAAVARGAARVATQYVDRRLAARGGPAGDWVVFGGIYGQAIRALAKRRTNWQHATTIAALGLGRCNEALARHQEERRGGGATATDATRQGKQGRAGQGRRTYQSMAENCWGGCGTAGGWAGWDVFGLAETAIMRGGTRGVEVEVETCVSAAWAEIGAEPIWGLMTAEAGWMDRWMGGWVDGCGCGGGGFLPGALGRTDGREFLGWAGLTRRGGKGGGACWQMSGLVQAGAGVAGPVVDGEGYSYYKK